MNPSLMIPAFVTAVSVGLGCGICCSPVISAFLSTYVISHAYSVKKGILSFVGFFFGKMLSVTFLCTLSALLGRQVLDESGCIGSFNLRLASRLAMGAIGLVLLSRWLWERRREGKCSGCKNCGAQGEGRQEKAGVFPMVAAGMIYGCTPCAPLLLMTGCCFTLPVLTAVLTGVFFSLASMAGPVFLLAMITGMLSGKMRKEIPHAVQWFRLASYLLLMVIPFALTE